MGNPFYTGGSATMNGINMQQIKQVYSMLRNSNNPDFIMNQMVQQHPQLAQTINLIKANGNYEQIFRDMCRQRGINADDFIRQINS